MNRVLVSWVGAQDLGSEAAGPVTSVLEDRDFDAVVLLLSGYAEQEKEVYKRFLEDRYDMPFHFRHFELDDPTDYKAIHDAVVDTMAYVSETLGQNSKLSIHVSSGTPAMHAVWVLLGSTRFPAELIQSSREAGVKSISIPYDISAEVLADAARWTDRKLEELALARPLPTPAFDDILGESRAMMEAKSKGHRAARANWPVLLEGESGTGKDLFARAIHSASLRASGPFIPVNCGALPESLAESLLFGHEKGAFTGADTARPGYFEQANDGTLFLDELGELPLDIQAKLLRVLEDGRLRRVGGETERALDVRILAATNRDLAKQVGDGTFRSDLYHRLAVLVVGLPPLRDREGDLGILIDHLLQELNSEAAGQPEFTEKVLVPGARDLLIRARWPGNVRQLRNVLMRLVVWTPGPKINRDDVRMELQKFDPVLADGILGRSIGGDFDIEEVIGEVMGHYINRAFEQGHSRAQAAKLLGLNDPNTLQRRINAHKKFINQG